MREPNNVIISKYYLHHLEVSVRFGGAVELGEGLKGLGDAHRGFCKMPNAERLEQYKWPKWHAYTVEECKALHVDDALPYLSSYHKSALLNWTPYTHHHLTLVSQMCGPFKRWWWQCPRCQRRVENLYVPPGAEGWDWRCRKCWSLIYASQRFGANHPLREKLTRRKEKSAEKEIVRMNRAIERYEKKFGKINPWEVIGLG